jgi:hypothetical protein
MTVLPARLSAMITACAVVLAMPALVAVQQPALDVTLKAAAAYLDRYPTDAAGVVLEEDYSQQLHTTTVTTRHLKSDVLIMADRGVGWIEFRDVFEVDGKPVRDRDDRLAKLFAQPTADADQQARRVVAEGVRFNLDAVVGGRRVSRTLNMPTAAMWFLRGANQPRSSFSRGGTATVADRKVAVVDFKETAKPRLIKTNSDAAARGTFWIDIETGAVLRSSLRLTNARDELRSDGTIKVDYGPDPLVKVWLPRAMDEHYEVSSDNAADLPSSPYSSPSQGRLVTQALGPANITIDGQATYSNIRHFTVAVDEQPTQ